MYYSSQLKAIPGKILYLVMVLLFGVASIAHAQPALNGNVEADFTGPYVVTINDPGGIDVGMPTIFPPGTISGNDIKDVRLYYDANADIMYVGVNTYNIATDVDNDGNPGNTGALLASTGGVDNPNINGTESISIYFDIDEDGTFDIIAGISGYPGQTGYPNYTVNRFSGSPFAPGQAYGSVLSGHIGAFSPNPSAATPDFECQITHWSQLPTSSGQDANIARFGLNAFIGSLEDDGIGEDFLLVGTQSVLVPLAAPGDVVWLDRNANGIQDAGEPGVPGITVNIYTSTGTLIATRTTDANGSYNFIVNPGNYYIGFVIPSDYLVTLQDQGGNDGLDSDVNQATGITPVFTLSGGEQNFTFDLGLVRPASIGNLVWNDLDGDGIHDSGEPGLSGVRVNLLDDEGNIVQTTTTNSQGIYTFNNVFPGDYIVEYILPQNALGFSPQNQGANDASDSDPNPATGRTGIVTVDFDEDNRITDAGVILPASIGNYVWEDLDGDGIQDSGEPPIQGVSVNLLDGLGNFLQTTTTNASGLYIFNQLEPGNYIVEFPTSLSNFNLSPSNQGGNDGIDSDANLVTGRTGVINLQSGENDLSNDAGYYQLASLGDYVWSDDNGDGVQNANENPVPGVTVNLLDEQGHLLQTTTTNSNGLYEFADLLPGDYRVEFILPTGMMFTRSNVAGPDNVDSDADRSTGRSHLVNLESGEHDMTIDAGILATGSIGDYVWNDIDGDGVQDQQEGGVPNVTVNLLNGTGNLLATTVTNNDGSYSFDNLFPGTYIIEFVAANGIEFTIPNQGDDATDSDADVNTGRSSPIVLTTGETDDSIDAGLIVPASLGDYVWEDLNVDGIQDQGEPGIPNVTVVLLDASGTLLATTTTDQNGLYHFIGLDPGDYRIRFTNPANYLPTLQNSGNDDTRDNDADPVTGESQLVNLESGENNPTIDAGYYRLASIGDFVWEDLDADGVQDQGEPGIPDVTVNLLNGQGVLISTTTTDGTGAYDFDALEPGEYMVEFVPPVNHSTSPVNASGDDRIDSDADPTNNHRSAIVSLESHETDNSVDAGFFQLASLGDYVWDDVNRNGIQDQGESPIPGVEVRLLDAQRNLLSTTTTDNSGLYGFSDLVPDDYIVEFIPPTSYTLTQKDAGGNDATDSDADPLTGQSHIVNLESDEHDPTIDAGMYQSSGLGDFVWNDLNANGIQDNGEPGIQNVTVNLLDGAGNFLRTTTTDANGGYSFDNLTPGSYIVEFERPTGFQPTDLDAGSDDALDSDANPTTGRTSVINLAANENIPTIDAGFWQPASLGNFVWDDLDADGTQDAGEPGISGVTVNLLDGSGNLLNTTTTNASGIYVFSNLNPDNYMIQFIVPDGYETSPLDASGDDATDSDANPNENYQSPVVTLTSGEFDESVDAGFYNLASLGDFVWDDFNRNGIQDQNENPIPDVEVRLLDEQGNLLNTKTTDANGFYNFSDLVPGNYIVEFVTPATYAPTQQNMGGDDVSDSDADLITGRSHIVNLQSDEHDPTIDAGYYQSSSLGDLVWNDLNANGIQDQAEPGIPDVVVNLLDGSGNFVRTTTTAANGAYRFDGLIAGNFIVEFIRPSGFEPSAENVGSDDALDSDASHINGRSPVITLAANENNPTIDAGFYQLATISDFVWEDINGNGVQDNGEPGIPNVVVNLLDSNGNQLQSTTTNSAGNYTFTDLVPGDYTVQFVTPNGMFPTLQDQGSDDSADSDLNPQTGQTTPVSLESGETNDMVDAGFYFPASLGDFVWEDVNRNGVQEVGEGGIVGMTVNLLDNLGNPIGLTTQTVQYGYYEFTDIAPGSYIVEFKTPATFYPTLQDQGVNDEKDSDINQATGYSHVVILESGEHNPTIDAGYFRNAGLGDYVWEDLNLNGVQDFGEPGIPGVTVEVWNSPNYDVIIMTTTTGPDGIYGFPTINPGTYMVKFVKPVGYESVPKNVGSDDTKDNDADEITGFSDYVILRPNEHNPTIDAGFYRPASLGDFVWEDLNGNGVQDQGEPGIGNVFVELLDEQGSTLQSMNTNPDGSYLFSDLEPGDYSVKFTTPIGYNPTLADQGQDDALDSDADPTTGRTQTIILASGDNNMTTDAGFTRPASLGDYVWNDVDRDGIQDNDEPGIEGVEVRLFDVSGNQLAITLTDATGLYQFAELNPGDYTVEFVQPGTYYPTVQNAGGNDEIDSDADPTTGRSHLVNLESGENDPTIDAGYYQKASLSDFVWEDLNGNGIQDQNEPGIADVVVQIFTQDGTTPLDQTTTDANGIYMFQDLTPGNYIVKFIKPAEYEPTAKDIGNNDATDSDQDPVTGLTDIVTLAPDENNEAVDAGFYKMCSLGDFVWEDVNYNGIQDANEPVIANVTVNLLDENGNSLYSTVTDANGIYSFGSLKPGNYIVEFNTVNNLAFSFKDEGSDDTIDSDVDRTTGRSDLVTLFSGEHNPTIDAGMFVPKALLGDYVWIDQNENGLQDANEPGVPGVTVTLFDNATNQQVGEPGVTNEHGYYQFENLIPGDYYVIFSHIPVNFALTSQNVGQDDEIDSDADPNPGLSYGKSDPVTVRGADILSIDAGIYSLTASLGDLVWRDLNANGIQDQGEPGFEDIRVNLYNDQGLPTGLSTLTDVNGNYKFADLQPGDYFVEFIKPEGYLFTHKDVNGNDNLDSDASRFTGRTVMTTLTRGEDDMSWDAGLVTDQDRDGIYDLVEDGDREGDDIPDLRDYDPAGWIYDEVNGEIIPGGKISVAGPGVVNIAFDGSTGFYTFFVGEVPGTYTITFTPPAGYILSPTHLPNPGSFNPSQGEEYFVMGLGSEIGNTGYLSNFSATDNPYYFSFELEQGDPIIINNNIPLRRLPPIAYFEADTTFGIGSLCVNFNNMSSNVDSILWNFGNGMTSKEMNPNMCFSNPPHKYYTIRLTVYNSVGSDTMERANYITVHRAAKVDFSAYPIVGVPGTEVQFENQSSGGVNRFTWTYGDGTNDQIQHSVMSMVHPIHVYEEPGEYTVSLSGDGHGGQDSVTAIGLVYIDSSYIDLILHEQGATMNENYSWENVIDHDVMSSDAEVIANRDDAWAVFEFSDSTVKMVNKIRLIANDMFGSNFNSMCAKEFEIMVSEDGANFTSAFKGALVAISNWEVFEFTPVAAKYIKLRLLTTRGDDMTYVSLTEFQVFGKSKTETRHVFATEHIENESISVVEVPKDFGLSQNYPNPFNPETAIQYQLPEAANVILKVYNILGQHVVTLLDARMNAGYHHIVWNGRDLYGAMVGSGIYFYSIEASNSESGTNYRMVKKMTLMK